MRIAFLADRIPPHHFGGGGKIPWRLACGLRDRGHDVHVITATPDSVHDELQAGIPVYHLHSRYPDRFRAWLSLYNPQTIPAVRRLLKQIQPDVVNVHNIHTDLSYASISTAHQMGFPVVFSAHDVMSFAYGKLTHFIDPSTCDVKDYRLPPGYNLRQMRLRYNPFRNVVIRRILNQHTHIRIAISQAHRAALEANNLPPFRVVYHGFDAAEYPMPSQDVLQRLRQRFHLEGRKIVFFGGRLTEFKGSIQLMRALHEVVPHVPEVLLVVASSVPLEREYLAENYICETGWLSDDDLLGMYHLADVVPVPSICLDTLPTTIFEAMAVGKPVIATCYGGSPELVQDGITGYVINPFDMGVFADRLTRLLRDDTLRQQMGAAAQQRLDAHFTFQTQLDHMLQAYQDARCENQTFR